MAAERNESSRTLLAKIESEWDFPPSERNLEDAKARAPKATSPELQAALDAAAGRRVDSLEPTPVSVPTMDELDSSWGEDDEEEDEVEPELPDERLDPVAYAAAKKARDERIEARRERRREKAEAKKARRKARLDAQKSKQKGKQKKARSHAPVAVQATSRTKPKAEARVQVASARATSAASGSEALERGEEAVVSASVAQRSRAKASPPSQRTAPIAKGSLSKTNQWMLAIAIGVFVAAAIFAAVVPR
jgi:hypothetical protein